MSLKFKALSSFKQWLIELESFLPVPDEFTPSDLKKITSSKNFNSLKSAVHDFRQRGGNVIFITRNPVLAGLVDNLDLNLQSSKELVTEHTLPGLKHGMNGGGEYNSAEILAFVSSGDMAGEFSDLGAGVVWMDSQEESIEEIRNTLVGRPNVVQVTVPDYMFMMIRHQWQAEQNAARRAAAEMSEFFEIPERHAAIG